METTTTVNLNDVINSMKFAQTVMHDSTKLLNRMTIMIKDFNWLVDRIGELGLEDLMLELKERFDQNEFEAILQQGGALDLFGSPETENLS